MEARTCSLGSGLKKTALKDCMSQWMAAKDVASARSSAERFSDNCEVGGGQSGVGSVGLNGCMQGTQRWGFRVASRRHSDRF